MRETRLTMGMPATVEIVNGTAADIDRIFAYFTEIDERFSPYKETSEVSRLNAGGQPESEEMRYILEQSERTCQETDGYFDIRHDGKIDPSGYVKGWAIQNAAERLASFVNYYVEIAGDLQVGGRAEDGEPWKIGVRNPFNRDEIIKRVALSDAGIATSGTAARGQHIYDPHGGAAQDIVSLTVIAPRIVDADRFATGAFAMGTEGIKFIARKEGLEGYMIDKDGLATFTPGFNRYVI